MGGHRIRNPARVATGSFAGYAYQILHTLLTWLSIDDGRIVIAEGNEDIDQVVLHSNERIEEQVKLRSGPVGQRDDLVTETVLNYLRAFAYHHEQGNKFIGILRTNARLAQQPTTNIGKWIAGREYDEATLLKEVEALASASDEDYTPELAYIKIGSRVADFLKSVEWADEAGTPEELEQKILGLLHQRVPEMRPGVAYRALLVHLLRTLTSSEVPHRVLRRVDVDIVLSDAAIEDVLRTAQRDEAVAWTAAIWTRGGTRAIAVAILVRDVESQLSQMQKHIRLAKASGRPADPEAVLRSSLRTLDFVAYASRRMYPGPRGERLCAYDVVKQAKYRITPTRVWSVQSPPPWLAEVVQGRWPPPEPVAGPIAKEVWLLQLATIVGEAVLDPSSHQEVLAAVESKLRWVHDVGAGMYFTAAFPLR